MANMIADISAMHKKFGFHTELRTNGEFLKFRWNFIVEEFNEMKEALENEDTEGFIDGGIDLIVVILGLFDLFGVDAQHSWNVVHDANMSKERGNNPSREGSGGVDLIKPDGWRAPDHSGNYGKLSGAMAEYAINSEADRIRSKMPQLKPKEREAVNVLQECIDLMRLKSQDYNSELGSVLPAHYYPYGMISIFTMLNTKLMRVKSVMENALSGRDTNFESIEDSLKDLMVYSSFAVEYNRRTMRGQQPGDDLYGNLRLRSVNGNGTSDVKHLGT